MRFVDSIKSFIAKVKSVFFGDKKKMDTAAQEKYGASVSELEAAIAQYEQMLDVTEAGVASGQFAIENTAGNESGGVQYSIKKNIEGEKRSYGKGVLLDTNIFDGVKPRNWGPILSRYVYKNLAGKELTMYDANGNPETVFVAKANDRVTKNGAKRSHKVIDKLARYKGDNVKALATVHLSEMLEVSTTQNSNTEHNHQWMDEKGWEYRKTYIEDLNGNIYEATLNIANGRDRRIIYEINNVRQIDKKRTSDGVVPLTENGLGSHINRSSSNNSIPETSEKSNTQKSLKTEDFLSPEYWEKRKAEGDGVPDSRRPTGEVEPSPPRTSAPLPEGEARGASISELEAAVASGSDLGYNQGDTDYTSPEYETLDTRKPIEPTDMQEDKKRRAAAAKKYGLLADEAQRLGNYVDGHLCYLLNRKMLVGVTNEGDISIINSIRNALLKMPEYSGRTYRNLKFDAKSSMTSFCQSIQKGIQ